MRPARIQAKRRLYSRRYGKKDLVVAPFLRPLADRTPLLAGAPVGVQRRVAILRCRAPRDEKPALAVLANPRPQFPFDTLAKIEINQIIDRPGIQYLSEVLPDDQLIADRPG